MPSRSPTRQHDKALWRLTQGVPIGVRERFHGIAVVAGRKVRAGNLGELPEGALEFVFGNTVPTEEEGVLWADDQERFPPRLSGHCRHGCEAIDLIFV